MTESPQEAKQVCRCSWGAREGYQRFHATDGLSSFPQPGALYTHPVWWEKAQLGCVTCSRVAFELRRDSLGFPLSKNGLLQPLAITSASEGLLVLVVLD